MPHDRFVSNTILNALQRPQRRYECSVNTVAGVVKALTGIDIPREEILKIADWDIDDVVAGNMGNDDVLNAIKQICKKKKLRVITDVFFRIIPMLDNSLWKDFVQNVRREDTVLIYHANNHYTLVAGFFEDPKCRYIVLADHSSDWDPIRVISWSALRKQLLMYRGYGILRVKKK